MIYIHHYTATHQLGLPLYYLLMFYDFCKPINVMSVVTDRLASAYFIRRTFEDIQRNRAVKLSQFFYFSELGSTFPQRNPN